VRLDVTTALLTALTMVAFASNSLLARLALGAGDSDPIGFTAIRLASGAVMLAVIVRAQAGDWTPLAPALTGPLILFAYAVPFSLAYTRIGAATGALVLFGAVQLAMMAYGLWCGERPPPMAWIGTLLATAGFVLLTAPGGRGLDLSGIALMAIAGAAWAGYTIAGRGSADPLVSNARSFLWSAPPALLLSAVASGAAVWTPRGIALAVLSGAVTSALGYVVWYRAVRGLTVMQAAVAQLSVPVIASCGAVVLLGETLEPRLAISAAAILGGIAMSLAARTSRLPKS
jgi:drug/metabolite transporter (DMT)-like permease